MKREGSILCGIVLLCFCTKTNGQNFTCEEENKTRLPRPDVSLVSSSCDDCQEPTRDGDHSLILGDCGLADIYDMYNFTDCTLPGNNTKNYYVRFYGHVEIYCIRVLDQMGEDDQGEPLGGYVFVDDGGIGYDFLQIHLIPQVNQGLKYVLEVYTRVLENTRPPTTTSQTLTN